MMINLLTMNQLPRQYLVNDEWQGSH